MFIKIKSPMNYYEMVAHEISAYFLYPNDEVKRKQYAPKQFMDHIYKNSATINVCKIFTNHPEKMAEISMDASQYRSPNHGYSVSEQSIAGHLLLAMIRMKISGIEPSLQKAFYFYLEITQKDPINLGRKKKKIRYIEQAWSKYKTIAHLGLVFGFFEGAFDVEDYPIFLSAIYSVQKLYLDILNENTYLNFTIWELPFIDQLPWSKSEKTYPVLFMKKFGIQMNFDPLNEKERNIISDYSIGYFKNGGAK